MSKSITMENLVSFAKRRGFVFLASEIYGGVSGIYDFGPYGVELKNNLKKLWWQEVVYENSNIFGLDSAIIQNAKVWQASGHVDRFNDPMVDCKKCKKRYRADKLANTDSSDVVKLKKIIDKIKCPNCNNNNWTEIRQFNLLMKTYLGPVENEASVSYLRGETCQGIYTNFLNVSETMRARLPFGVAQIGKAFRNEITPGDFLFRQREFEQAELQIFVEPSSATKIFETWKSARMKWLQNFLQKENLRYREHNADERAHYAKAAWDIEYNFPFGFKEIEGIHNRGDWDLSRHSQYSSRELQYYDEKNKKSITPWVIETSIGVDRLFLATLLDAYNVESVNGDNRVVLKLANHLAPVKVAILPLSKKPELSTMAQKVFSLFSGNFNIEYDETQSIGKRYRRQDEIGTPYCVTIDFDSLEDNSVTVRERDSMKQSRIKIEKLKSYLDDKLNLNP